MFLEREKKVFFEVDDVYDYIESQICEKCKKEYIANPDEDPPPCYWEWDVQENM